MLNLDSVIEQINNKTTPEELYENIHSFCDKNAVFTYSIVAEKLSQDKELSSLSKECYIFIANKILNSKELATIENLLVALLCFEKAAKYENALSVYKFITFHYRLGEIWLLLLEGINNRILAKNAKDNNANLLAGFYFKRASELFDEAARKSNGTFKRKWIMSAEEMNQKHKNAVLQFLENEFNYSRFVQTLHSFNNKLSSDIWNTKIIDNEELIFITGGIHGNEISGIYGVNEFCRMIKPSDNSIIFWPCVDLNGFWGNRLLINFCEVDYMLKNTEFIKYNKEYKTFLIKPDKSATKEWLSDFLNFVVLEKKRYDAQYAIWVSSASNECYFGRSFEIKDNSLIQLFSQEATNAVSEYFKTFLKKNNFLWIDLHECRGNKFHLYVNERNEYLLKTAKDLILYLSNQCPINTEIWNRTKIADGIFSFPNNYNDWDNNKRIVLEIGEELPLYYKVGILFHSLKFIIKAVRNGYK